MSQKLQSTNNGRSNNRIPGSRIGIGVICIFGIAFFLLRNLTAVFYSSTATESPFSGTAGSVFADQPELSKLGGGSHHNETESQQSAAIQDHEPIDRQSATTDASDAVVSHLDLKESAISNLLEIEYLSEQASIARKNFQNDLQTLYGDYYLDIFEPYVDVATGQRDKVGEDHGRDAFAKTEKNPKSVQRISIGRLFYKSPANLLPPDKERDGAEASNTTERDLGWKRMVRKMQLKILQVQLAVVDQIRHNEKDNDHFVHAAKKNNDPYYADFTWVTAGNG